MLQMHTTDQLFLLVYANVWNTKWHAELKYYILGGRGVLKEESI